MTTSLNAAQVCQCGRPRSRLHCPFCGGATVVARPSRARTVNEKRIMNYVCRKCGRDFDDLHRELCCAPAPLRGRSLKATVVDNTNYELASMSREQRVQWVKDQLNRKRGMS
jgi:transposase-like protein